MVASSRALSEGMELVGESGKKYLLVGALGARPGMAPNVWTAVDADTASEVVIIKQPNAYDTRGWPDFQQELIMHELFKDCDYIRRQVDKIAPSSVSPLPAVVLEAFEGTAWSARASRPFTPRELKTIMKDTLLGLKEIHAKGMVYADLKMENIVLNGFRVKPENGDSKLVAKISDLGTVMYPATGKAQPIAYRSPEVHFKNAITPAADIWGWGVIYCHLLEAQASHLEGGMYDTEYKGTIVESERAVKRAIQNDFDISNVPYYKDVYVPSRDSDHTEQEQLFSRLARKGVPENEIYFLKCVLNPDPTKRPTADDILAFEWLDTHEGEDSDKIPEVRTPEERPEAELHRPSASRGTSMLNSSPAAAAAAAAYHTKPSGAPSRPPLKATNTGTFLSYVSMRSESGTPAQTPPVSSPPGEPADPLAHASNASNTATVGESPAVPDIPSPMHASNGSTYLSYMNGARGSNAGLSASHMPSNLAHSSTPDEPQARPSLAGRKGTGTFLSYSSGSPFGAPSPALSYMDAAPQMAAPHDGGATTAKKDADVDPIEIDRPDTPLKRPLSAHVEDVDDEDDVGEGRTKISRTHS